MSLKAVLDTNVLISGVLWKGTPFKILKWAEEHRLLIYSRQGSCAGRCSCSFLRDRFLRILG